MRVRETARRVALGYARLFRSLGEGLLVFAGMAGTALGIAFPIWWLAVNRRGLYTALVAGGCLAAAAVLAVRRAGTARRSAAPGARASRPLRLAARLAFAAGVYGSAVLFARSLVLGLLSVAVLLAVAGVWIFGRGEPAGRGR